MKGCDVETVDNWKDIGSLMSYATKKGYNAISVDQSKQRFSHASFKKISTPVYKNDTEQPDSGQVVIFVKEAATIKTIKPSVKGSVSDGLRPEGT